MKIRRIIAAAILCATTTITSIPDLALAAEDTSAQSLRCYQRGARVIDEEIATFSIAALTPTLSASTASGHGISVFALGQSLCIADANSRAQSQAPAASAPDNTKERSSVDILGGRVDAPRASVDAGVRLPGTFPNDSIIIPAR